MSNPTDPRRVPPGTYFVQNRSDEDEITRLRVQDQMITTSMGGVLPEQPDPTIFERVLDVGCGTGGWLIETAQTYPSIKQLVGVDISSKMLDYAREQAQEQQVSDRVTFRVMDALLMLEFPPAYFDLVNLRYGMSWLRTWDWPKLLQEFQRVTRPGGVIRLTDTDLQVADSFPALKQLNDLFIQAFYQSGHLFTPDKDGIIGQLADLLQRYGCLNVQTCAHTMEVRGGTQAGQRFYEDVRLLYRTILPFFRKWIRLPDNYEEIYQQMLDEVRRPDFVEKAVLLTVWGNT